MTVLRILKKDTVETRMLYMRRKRKSSQKEMTRMERSMARNSRITWIQMRRIQIISPWRLTERNLSSAKWRSHYCDTMERLPGTSRMERLPSKSRMHRLPCTSGMDRLPCKSRMERLPCKSRMDRLPCKSRMDRLPCKSRMDRLPCKSRMDRLPCKSRMDCLQDVAQFSRIKCPRNITCKMLNHFSRYFGADSIQYNQCS